MHQTIRKTMTAKPLVIIACTALLLYTLLGFFALPAVLRWRLPAFAQERLHCQVTIEDIDINPFLLSIEIRGFSLRQTDGAPLAAFSRLLANLKASSLFRWALVLEELALERPEIQVALEPDGSFNVEKLVNGPPRNGVVGASRPLPVLVEHAVIQEGRLTVADRHQGSPADLTLENISLQAQHLGTIGEHAGSYLLTAATAAAETVRLEGEYSPVTLRAAGTVAVNGLRLDSPWQFLQKRFNIAPPGGRIDLSAKYLADAAARPVQATLEDIRLAIADLSLQLRDGVRPLVRLKKAVASAPRFDLAARQLHVDRLLLEDGAVDVRIDASGRVNAEQIVRAPAGQKEQRTAAAPAEMAAPFKLQLDAFEVKQLALELDDRSRRLPLTATAAGIDLRLRADLELGARQPAIALAEMAADLGGITVRSAGAKVPLFAMDKVQVAGGSLDLGARSITLDRIALRHGRVDVDREADGAFTWQRLLEPESDGTADTASAASALPPWTFLVKSLAVEDLAARFTDLTTSSSKPVFGIRNLNTTLKGIGGASPMDCVAAFEVEQGGDVSFQGTVQAVPPAVAGEVRLNGVALASLQPYLEPFVSLELRSGQVTASGHLEYGLAASPHRAAYEGSFFLNNLRLTETGSNPPFLSWDALQLSRGKLTLQPNRLEAPEIKLFRPAGELIIGEDQTLNTTRIVKTPFTGDGGKPTAGRAATATAQQNSRDAFSYQISRVRVENGNLVFADLGLRPQFKTRIQQLKGTITGLSSTKDAQATLQMEGQVDQYGTAKITGTIRPVDLGRASEFDLVFRNLDMKNLSPYSGKFAGHLINSGKISADLHYNLKEYLVRGDNRFVIDNLVLGDTVDTPGATRLPLSLAIALLSDANGRIEIGLPVSGDLKDPQFSMGSLIWKMFTSLIAKATTSPFLALASLLGADSQRLDAVAFPEGSADLTPPEQEKLASLAAALQDRPQLTLVVQGRYNPEADGLVLRKHRVARRIAARPGDAIGEEDFADEPDMADRATRKRLEQLYADRFGEASLRELDKGIAEGTVQPRRAGEKSAEKARESGLFAGLHQLMPGGKSPEQAAQWTGELHARLVAGEQLGEEILVQLAERRAQAIVTELAEQHHISRERLRLKTPEPVTDGDAPTAALTLDAL